MMLYIEDSGLTKTQTRVLELAGRWAGRQLRIPKNTRVIVACIRFVSAKHRKEKVMAEVGCITPRLYMVSLSPTVVRWCGALKIDGLDFYFHELTHVKQYALGQLHETKVRGREIWKGRDVTDIDYWQKPYEKEAFSRGRKLAYKFRELADDILEGI